MARIWSTVSTAWRDSVRIWSAVSTTWRDGARLWSTPTGYTLPAPPPGGTIADPAPATATPIRTPCTSP